MSDKLLKFGLAGNTFLEERHDFPMVGRSEEWTNAVEVLQDLLKADSCGIMTVFGDYGMGKTFTLKRIRDQIRSGHLKSSNGETIGVFLKSIESQVPSNYLANLLMRSFRELGKQNLEEIAKQIKYDRLELSDDTLSKVFKSLADSNEIAWNWLIGRPLSASQLKEIKPSFKMTDNKETHALFRDFLRILRAAKYHNFVILLDEWEYLLSVAAGTKLRNIIHDMQTIWDSYNEANPDERKSLCKVIFVIGCSPDSWQRFIELAQADRERKGGGGTETFLRRIPEKAKIILSPLKDKDIRRFLANRISVYRVKEIADDLYPFDESYVRFISEISMGIPSHVLNLTSLIIDDAADKGLKKIDRSAAEGILKQFGMLRELEPVRSARSE